MSEVGKPHTVIDVQPVKVPIPEKEPAKTPDVESVPEKEPVHGIVPVPTVSQ